MNTNKDNFSNKKFTAIDVVITIIACISFISLVLSCFLYYNWTNQIWLLVIGWITILLSPIPGLIARFSFKKKGGVSEGESCLKTNIIVNSGIYSVVRNPMYISPMIFTVGLILISHHWLSLISAIPIIFYFYHYMIIEEKLNISKFGNDYRSYLKKVPRINIIAGFIRLKKS